MERENRKHIVIIGTSDVHGEILGYSYEDNTPKSNCGLSRIQTYLETVRKEADGVLLLDAGDFFQGNILTDDLYRLEWEGIHPVLAAMNALHYDAMTLGNHEFNWGTTKLLRALEGATFPILGANVLDKDGRYLTGQGTTIIERCGIRFGIIGVVTPDVPYWDGSNEEVKLCSFLPAPETVRMEMAHLKDDCDIVIVSAHMGMGGEFASAHDGDSGKAILEMNPEVTLLQVGHMHISTKGQIGEALYGGAKNEGAEVVRFDLYFAGTELVEKNVSLVPMTDFGPSPILSTVPAIKEAHQKTIRFASGTDEASVLGSTTAVFQPENTYRDVPEAYLRNTPLPDFLNQVQLEATGADCSAVPLFKMTSNLPKGNIYYKDIFGIYKFANTLCKVRLTGKEMKKWLEYNASFYQSEGNVICFKADFPYYMFDLFQGVDYTIDLSRKVGERIQGATLRGIPLEEVPSLTVAVALYRFTVLTDGKGILKAESEWEAPLSVRDYIVAYFKNHGALDPKTFLKNNWHLAGIEGKKFLSKGLGVH